MASIYVRTTGGAWRLERDDPANRGEAAKQVWQEIQQGLPIMAIAAELQSHLGKEPLPVVLNPAQVVAVVENE